jgi:uncharacterized protein YprB with RNaseH-like and TPR domain/DNA-directed RNA polymerase subunit RPC12/RpoP
LPISYVCRKCGKTHSKQDYDESRFCKTCGSYLILTYDVERSQAQSTERRLRKGIQITEEFASKPGCTTEDITRLTRAAKSLRQRISRAREYEIIPEKGKAAETTTATESWIWDSEYHNSLKLEKELIRKFKEKSLEEAIPGTIISNEHGECYSASTTCVAKFRKASYEKSRRLIISDLKLIPGIGPKREYDLKQQGYTTIEALTNHPIWKKPAQKFMQLVDTKEVQLTQDWLWQRLPKSHPLAHYLAGFCNDEDFAIIDIETLGLSERPIILMGIAKPTKNSICTSQFLLRDIPDEPSAIWALLSKLEPHSSLITFNGKSFDIPYIKQRLAYYGMDASLRNPHFDVLHFTRRAFSKKLTDCRLETVEKYLNIEREINIPGALVPHFYDTYLRTRNVGPLVAIVEHNKQDLITLGNLFSRLYEEWDL